MSDSYITDVVFTSTYNRIHNPIYLSYIANLKGAWRPFSPVFTYCDLGCGDGTSLNMLAAMYPKSRFYGFDINAEHIRTGRETAENAGLDNVVFHELSFVALGDIDIPVLDYISCLGAFSWIDESLQNHVLDFVSRRLSETGLFLVEYTANPGKIQVDAMWHLMRVATSEIEGGAEQRVRGGLKLIREMLQSNADFFMQNPVAKHVAINLDEADINNIAHNCLTKFKVLDFSSVSSMLSRHGLEYRASGLLIDNFESLVIPSRFNVMLSGSEDIIIRETIKDFIVNRGIHYDMYRRSGNDSLERDRMHGLGVCRSMLTDRPPARMTFPSGQVIDFSQGIYRGILDIIQHNVMSLGVIEAALSTEAHDPAQFESALDIMIAADILMPCMEVPATEDVSAGNAILASSLSYRLIEMAVESSGLGFLPSVTLGQCVAISPVMSLFLWADFIIGASEPVPAILGRFPASAYPINIAGRMVKDMTQMKYLLMQAESGYREHFVPWMLAMGVMMLDEDDHQSPS